MHSFVKCEAVKVSYRQTKDGMVVAFAIHPNDMPSELALAPVGTRVLLAVAEITDEEPAPAKPDGDRSEAARERYRLQDPMAKARDRAILLCKDPAFQRWIAEELPHIEACGKTEEDKAAVLMRAGLQIASRSLIATNEQAYKRFLALEAEFKAHTGQLAEARG